MSGITKHIYLESANACGAAGTGGICPKSVSARLSSFLSTRVSRSATRAQRRYPGAVLSVARVAAATAKTRQLMNSPCVPANDAKPSSIFTPTASTTSPSVTHPFSPALVSSLEQ